tara:strand:+ start:117 stop:446 length:330 start_codon:yes stop_codon:yes gene_type:complete
LVLVELVVIKLLVEVVVIQYFQILLHLVEVVDHNMVQTTVLVVVLVVVVQVFQVQVQRVVETLHQQLLLKETMEAKVGQVLLVVAAAVELVLLDNKAEVVQHQETEVMA